MLAIRGIFDNGKLILNEKINISKPIEVIVTFIEDIREKKNELINLKQFSFTESQEILKDYSGSISDAVIEERNSEF
ncbi:MAG: hypothetical protein K8S23_04535 [Candidatus Cloacimonetes bacterium]|nr:hypothetical protein [Candidatus Cloacimonadota bacterium]